MKKFNLDDYIEDIELNGLKGRVVNCPATTRKAQNLNILFFHGHHSSHERLAGVVEVLRELGNVCIPDMPGFGGMDHFYSIGEKPTIDNYADYMAAFAKLRYGSRGKFLIVGYSMGFMVVTRMLQKYPGLYSQIKDIIAIAGLVRGDEFKFTRRRMLFYKIVATILKIKPISWVTREVFLRKWFLGMFYTKTHNAKEKFSGLSAVEHDKAVDFEVRLWRINHVPTWCYTTLEMFRRDLITGSQQIPLGVISVVVDADRYFDGKVTEQHLNIVYNKVKTLKATIESHGGATFTTDEVRKFIPPTLRKHIRSLQ